MSCPIFSSNLLFFSKVITLTIKNYLLPFAVPSSTISSVFFWHVLLPSYHTRSLTLPSTPWPLKPPICDLHRWRKCPKRRLLSTSLLFVFLFGSPGNLYRTRINGDSAFVVGRIAGVDGVAGDVGVFSVVVVRIADVGVSVV